MRSFEISLSNPINIDSLIVTDYSIETIWGNPNLIDSNSKVSQIIRNGSGSSYYYTVNLQYSNGSNISATSSIGNYSIGTNAINYSNRYSALVSKNTPISTISGSQSNNTLLFNDGIVAIVSNNGYCLEIYDPFIQDNGSVYTDIIRNDENSIFSSYKPNTVYTTGTLHIGYTNSGSLEYYGNIVHINAKNNQVLYQTNATYIAPSNMFYSSLELANSPKSSVDESGYFTYTSNNISALNDHAIVFSNITIPIKPEFIISGLSDSANIEGYFTAYGENTLSTFNEVYSCDVSTGNRVYKFSTDTNTSISQFTNNSISLKITSDQNKEYFYIY